jgi:TonB family protein
MCHLRGSLMCRLSVRFLVAALTFVVGLAAGALWSATTGTPELPTPAMMMPVLVAGPSCDKRTDGPRDSGATRVVSGGILNDRAISKPAPADPTAGTSLRLRGTVAVSVRVDEGGRVEAAWAVSGHPLLQQAAVAAAREARFAPTRLSGRPVKVAGLLTYDFARD